MSNLDSIQANQDVIAPRTGQVGARQAGLAQNFAAGIDAGLNSTSVALLNRWAPWSQSELIPQTDFESMGYKDAGIVWRPSMTWAEASAASEARNGQRDAAELAARSTTLGMAANFAGSFVGSAVDPINLLPVGALNMSRTLLSNVVRIGAINAGLEAVTTTPLEYLVSQREQTEFGVKDALINMGFAAGVGILFGGAGYGISRWLDASRALHLNGSVDPVTGRAVRDSTTPATASDQWLADTLAGKPAARATDAAPTTTAAAATDAAPSVTAAPAADAPAAPALAPPSRTITPAERDASMRAAERAASGDQPPVLTNVRFPTESERILYEFDANNPAHVSWAQLQGYETTQDAERFARLYRWAVAENNRGIADDAAKVAPRMAAAMDSVELRTDFSDNMLAQKSQRRVDAEQGRVGKLAALDQVLQQRAEDLARGASWTDPVPVHEPDAGVLMLRRSPGKQDGLREYPVSEWWRRQITEATGPEGMRAEGGDKLLSSLKQLTPEQLDWLVFRHLTDHELSMLSKAAGLDGSGAREWAENVRTSVWNREGARRSTGAPSAQQLDQIMDQNASVNQASRLAFERQALAQGDDVAARLALTGIHPLQNHSQLQDALNQRFGPEVLNSARADIEPALTRAKNYKQMLMDTAMCLIGA